MRRRASMLSLRAIDAGYDDALTLRGVSLEVERGEIVAMIGANGAGKSTTLRTICGFLRPRKGAIEFDGRTISGLTPDRIAALGLVHVPEGRRVFAELSVEENLLAAAYLVRERREVSGASGRRWRTSRCSSAGAARARARFRAANSRCSRSAAR